MGCGASTPIDQKVIENASDPNGENAPPSSTPGIGTDVSDKKKDTKKTVSQQGKKQETEPQAEGAKEKGYQKASPQKKIEIGASTGAPLGENPIKSKPQTDGVKAEEDQKDPPPTKLETGACTGAPSDQKSTESKSQTDGAREERDQKTSPPTNIETGAFIDAPPNEKPIELKLQADGAREEGCQKPLEKPIEPDETQKLESSLPYVSVSSLSGEVLLGPLPGPITVAKMKSELYRILQTKDELDFLLDDRRLCAADVVGGVDAPAHIVLTLLRHKTLQAKLRCMSQEIEASKNSLRYLVLEPMDIQAQELKIQRRAELIFQCQLAEEEYRCYGGDLVQKSMECSELEDLVQKSMGRSKGLQRDLEEAQTKKRELNETIAEVELRLRSNLSSLGIEPAEFLSCNADCK